MEGQYNNLSELDFGSNWVPIKVRIGRLWYSVSQANEVYTINMQLLDCKGNQRAALIPKHLVVKFKDLLEEGKIYEIRRFNVWDSKREYRVIDENFTIHIKGDTTINLINSMDNGIQRYKFCFADDDNVLASRANKKEQLTDVYGIITGFTNLLPVTTLTGVQKSKRELELQIKGGKRVIVTLWADKTDLVNESVMTNATKPITAVITSNLVSNYNAKFSYSSTLATKIYLNISIPETDEILQSCSLQQSFNGDVTLIQNSNLSINKVEVVESSLAEMMSDVANSTFEGKKYKVEATVMKLDRRTSWSYISCPKCKRTVRNESDGYKCGSCATLIDKPKARFRVGVEIFDATRAITVTAFDNVAETMIGRTVEEMITISKMENGDSRVQKIFDNIVGLDANFEFKPTEDNSNYRGNRLTIMKISNLKPPKHTPTNLSQLSDCMLPSDQSTTVDTTSNLNQSDSDKKGKKLMFEEKERSNSIEEYKAAVSESASVKK